MSKSLKRDLYILADDIKESAMQNAGKNIAMALWLALSTWLLFFADMTAPVVFVGAFAAWCGIVASDPVRCFLLRRKKCRNSTQK